MPKDSSRIFTIFCFQILLGISNVWLSLASDGYFYDEKDYEVGKTLILGEEGEQSKRHFEIKGHLGKGRQGTVFLVEESTETRHARIKGVTASHDHMYAMKKVSVTFGPQADNGKNIEAEIKALIDCQSQHVVKYYDHFQKDISHAWVNGEDGAGDSDYDEHNGYKTLNKERLNVRKRAEKSLLEAIRDIHPENFPATGRVYFILMEVLRNGSLKNLLAALKHSSKKMPMENVRFFAADITLGLGGVHMHRYIFHDLKPDNLLIDDRGHLKIADFGAARKVDENPKALGTPHYVAPEVLSAHGKEVDWWSMGSVLFEMIYQHVVDPGLATSNFVLYLVNLATYMATFTLPADPSVPEVAKKFLLFLLENDPNEQIHTILRTDSGKRLERKNTEEDEKKGDGAVKADPFFAHHGLGTEDEWKAHTQKLGPYHKCERPKDPHDPEKMICYRAGVHGECNICDISDDAIERHLKRNVTGFENGERTPSS